jgi:hypothetical protein
MGMLRRPAPTALTQTAAVGFGRELGSQVHSYDSLTMGTPRRQHIISKQLPARFANDAGLV